MTEFEVAIFKHNNDTDNNNTTTSRYKAYWQNGCYYAKNLRVELKVGDYCSEYISGHSVLDSVISEAEHILLDEKFGIATIYDGKYIVAVITKKAQDYNAHSNLTTYGEHCSNNEH